MVSPVQPNNYSFTNEKFIQTYLSTSRLLQTERGRLKLAELLTPLGTNTGERLNEPWQDIEQG